MVASKRSSSLGKSCSEEEKRHSRSGGRQVCFLPQRSVRNFVLERCQCQLQVGRGPHPRLKVRLAVASIRQRWSSVPQRLQSKVSTVVSLLSLFLPAASSLRSELWPCLRGLLSFSFPPLSHQNTRRTSLRWASSLWPVSLPCSLPSTWRFFLWPTTMSARALVWPTPLRADSQAHRVSSRVVSPRLILRLLSMGWQWEWLPIEQRWAQWSAVELPDERRVWAPQCPLDDPPVQQWVLVVRDVHWPFLTIVQPSVKENLDGWRSVRCERLSGRRLVPDGCLSSRSSLSVIPGESEECWSCPACPVGHVPLRACSKRWTENGLEERRWTTKDKQACRLNQSSDEHQRTDRNPLRWCRWKKSALGKENKQRVHVSRGRLISRINKRRQTARRIEGTRRDYPCKKGEQRQRRRVEGILQPVERIGYRSRLVDMTCRDQVEHETHRCKCVFHRVKAHSQRLASLPGT